MSTAFRIMMTGGQETPPNGSAAQGLGTVVFDSATNTAQYEINVRGLDFGVTLGGPAQTANPNDNVLAFHVHNAAPGVAGPVVFGQIGPAHDANNFAAIINSNGSTTLSGRWDAADGGAGIGGFIGMMGAAAPGNVLPLYFNAHTSGFGGGEIRGQWVCIADDFSNNVAGTSGPDILPGLMGNDTLNGFNGNDRLIGGDHKDKLSGGPGIDTLNGGNGKDALRGDAGADQLVGGGGKDSFIYQSMADSPVAAADQIFDYNPGIGETINLVAIDADLGAAGDQAFVIVGAFGSNVGEATLTFFAGPNVTHLDLDQNGDGIADARIIINGNQTAGLGLVL